LARRTQSPYTLSGECNRQPPGDPYESQPEQGHPDRQSRRRSRSPLHHGRQSRRHVLAGHQPQLEWHRCVVWNSKASTLADIVERYLKKGDKIYVEGRIEYRQWQDKENQTRYTTEINVRELIMLSGKAGGSDSYDSESAGGSNSRPRAAATDRTRAAGAGTGAAGGDFEDFRGNLDTEDDDLPF
jgi:single-strand DNA-binding protein